MPAVMEQIDRMSVDEKIEVMDYLWTALEAVAGDYNPPSWHCDELERRKRLYAEGKVPVYDWADVKERLLARRAAL